MDPRRLILALTPLLLATAPPADGPPPVSERAARVHAAGMLFDGHNDLPWRLREDGDVAFARLDIGKRLDSGQTDIPRLRQGGVKAQFWSVYTPVDTMRAGTSLLTTLEQIELVKRMIARYPETFALALSANTSMKVPSGFQSGQPPCPFKPTR